jgi:hypothetical protein
MDTTKEKTLSGTQLEALEWLHKEGGALRKTWRNAGISATTMQSLRERGMVEWFEAPFGGIKYVATAKGVAALEA